jgi:hypothetical protein
MNLKLCYWKWSKDYTSGIKKMQTQPIITEKHYADAYDWV